MTEWIKAREVLSRAGLDPMEHRKRSPLGNAVLDRVKADCAQMRGKRYTIDGQPCASSTIGPMFFAGPNVWADWVSGNFECHSAMRDHAVIDAEFRLDDIADLIEAYSVASPASSRGPVGGEEKDKGGKKPELHRWQVFYFAAIELAKEGRLSKDHFPSQASLREELLEMMGPGAFSEDHVKAQTAQIYKKFIGDPAG